MAAHPLLTTLHLYEVAGWAVPLAVSRMAVDRPGLRRTPGLRFHKLLGTAGGPSFGVRDADPQRWGLLAVWEGPEALGDFERSSPVVAAWRRIARARWRADLRLLRSRGSWAGREPFGVASPAPADGPVAVVTRARLRPARAWSFWAAAPAVGRRLAHAPGLRLAIGIGEAPLGLQGTFSVWDSTAAFSDFAYRDAEHREAIRRTDAEGWYAEELFARFAVLQVTGSLAADGPGRRSRPPRIVGDA